MGYAIESSVSLLEFFHFAIHSVSGLNVGTVKLSAAKSLAIESQGNGKADAARRIFLKCVSR